MPVGVNYELSRPGFPQNPGWQMPFNAASCVDLNQDGHDAYVVSDTGGDIFAWKNDGTTFLTGHTNGLFARLPTSTHAAVTVDDIQGDNHLEVVCAADNGKLYAYTSSGTPVPGFPVTTLDRITATPVLCDLDHDGKKEIIVGSTDGNLYVWRGNGKSYPGFPVQLGSEIRAAVALTDLQQPRIAVLGSDGRLFLVNPDGTIAPGFPVNLNVGSLYTYAAPVVGDVDHNGQREIVCVVSGGYNYKTVTVGLDGKVRYQSQSLIENPFYGTPLLAGLNPDGELETVLAAYHSIYAFNGNDAQVSNYPFSQDSVFYFIKAETLSEGIYLFNFTSDFIYSSSPVMADVDGSGTPSIVIGSPQWGVLAFNARTGKSLNWSPLTTIGSVSATPLICDADHDGKLEVAVGSDDGTFHVWKLPGNPNSIIWGSFLKDPDHTGLYTDTVSSGSLASAPKVLGKFYVYPNPAQKHATARYALGAVTNAKAQIKLLDVSGQSLVDMAGTAYPSTDNELEFSTLSVPTGVYIVRLEVNSDQGRVVKFYKLGVSR
jgi:hypothetical protein